MRANKAAYEGLLVNIRPSAPAMPDMAFLIFPTLVLAPLMTDCGRVTEPFESL